MEKKIHTYENDDIKIHYDVNRCIHAAECVKGMRSVFNPDKRPWIQPEGKDADEIAEVVTHCPTGALQYERKDGGPGEEVPEVNTITISPDGPVYIQGDLEVQDHEGNVILEDTRFALCRCGKSDNKPACDNTHKEIEFEAASSFDRSSLKKEDSADKGGKLLIKMMKDGPALVEGSYQVYSISTQPESSSKNIALCRCGASGNKPYCDGTHKAIGFES